MSKAPTVYEIYEEAVRRLLEGAKGYLVRNATHGDIDKVIEINMAALPEHYPRSFFVELLENWGKSFFVVESPERDVVGYVMCRVEIKPGFFRKLLVRSGHIVSLAVLENHRRKGLGYALMAHAMKSLYDDYNCSETYLEVRVSNTPAIKLYEKLGYKVAKVEKAYYLDGEDAYVMARKLP